MALIVLLDDEEGYRYILKGLLISEGHKVIDSGNKQEYLVQHPHITPDLVITDINSPKMDGFTFLRIFKREVKNKNVPVIFVTGFSNEANEKYAMEHGAFSFFRKGIDFEKLYEVIQEALKLRAKINKPRRQRLYFGNK